MFLFLVWVLPTIFINITNNFFHVDSEIKLYSILDISNSIEEIIRLSNREIIINQDSNITYENSCSIDINLNDFIEGNNYQAVIYCNNEKQSAIDNINVQKTTENVTFAKEGKQDVKVEIYINENLENTYEKTIYYVKPYERQFLDEKEEYGVSTHFAFGTDGTQSLELVKKLGIKKVRDDCLWKWIIGTNGQYNFNRYDNWINECTENGISVIPIMFGPGDYAGDDNKISSQEELEGYIEFITVFAKRYPQILEYEIWNEPNDLYTTEEDIKWYSKAVEEAYKALKQINPEIKIISGSTDTSDAAKVNTLSFFETMLSNNAYNYSDAFSYHPYDVKVNDMTNSLFYNKLNNHENLINENGGFLYTYITEYGGSTHQPYGMTEEEQAIKLVTQTSILKRYNVKSACIYNVRNYGNNNAIASNNYGILNYDYTPKPAYYAMKNYYENTNGAEYIGTINLADGLEAHVYDKDGKPKIIAWATNSNNTITIPYEDFTASDLYGNEIENTNETLDINTSPVYLDNISNKYFYEAISNTALEKYAEFEEKFVEQIEEIEGLSEKITELKTYMTNIANNETETQANALKQMSEHFAIGDTLLNAYENEILDIEYVTLSSMLDMLNDIGDSYEDLVTVSATTREGYFEATNNLIQEAENKINNNSDLEIIYPSKILDFAKELDEKAEYILSLEEENDIKTGLMVSNSLHAYYLANWANRFAQLYINDDIKNNPVTINYSETELTNQNVTVTLNVPQGTIITNNEGKNTYVFEQNDKFTFEYERRGQAFTIDAQVSNIDKDAPSIRGVIDGKIYISDVSFSVNDDNLEKVEVTFNGTLIEYANGQKLSEEGIYHINATDKAGNILELEFYIVEEITDDYIIKDNYLLNIKQNTSMTNFIAKFGVDGNYELTRDNEPLGENDIVATGDVLQLENEQQYTIIVAGDINKDGKITVYDYTTVRRTILRLRELNEIEALAADINLDNKEIGVKDYTRMRIELLGEY